MQVQCMNITKHNIVNRVSQVKVGRRSEGSIIGAWRDVESHAGNFVQQVPLTEGFRKSIGRRLVVMVEPKAKVVRILVWSREGRGW